MDPPLEVDARFECPQHVVGCAEDAVEELQFGIEKLEDAFVGLVGAVDEVDHDDIVLLAVAVTAADALFDALRVPR